MPFLVVYERWKNLLVAVCYALILPPLFVCLFTFFFFGGELFFLFFYFQGHPHWLDYINVVFLFLSLFRSLAMVPYPLFFFFLVFTSYPSSKLPHSLSFTCFLFLVFRLTRWLIRFLFFTLLHFNKSTNLFSLISFLSFHSASQQVRFNFFFFLWYLFNNLISSF